MHKMSLAAAALLVASQIGSASAQTPPTTIILPVQPGFLQNLGSANVGAQDPSNDRGDNREGTFPIY